MKVVYAFTVKKIRIFIFIFYFFDTKDQIMGMAGAAGQS